MSHRRFDCAVLDWQFVNFRLAWEGRQLRGCRSRPAISTRQTQACRCTGIAASATVWQSSSIFLGNREIRAAAEPGKTPPPTFNAGAALNLSAGRTSA